MLLNILKVIFLCWLPALLFTFALMKYANLRNIILCNLITGVIFFGLMIFY